MNTRHLVAAAAIALPLLFVSSDSIAQAVRVSAQSEVFRKDANGRRLAEVLQGTRVALVRTQGDWAEVTMEGWVRASALAPTSREGFNGVVTRVGGEELRASPDGEVIGRLLQGFLLEIVEEGAAWSRVRRTGWMWRSSLSDLMASGAGNEADPARPTPPAVVAAGERVVAGSDPVDLRTAPAGDAIAVIHPGSGLRVVERGSGWTRVIIDGWVRSSELATSNPDSILVGVSAAAVRATPEEYLGRTVRWSVQFISLEQAEAERTDFFEGEPFILARAPDPGDGFVYLAVPSELLRDVQQLDALEMIDVLAQVRTGRSALMGRPVLDLVAIF